MTLPTGFEQMPPHLAAGGPFHELIGPIFIKRLPNGLIAGLHVDRRHENLAGNMHGGMLASFVDTAFAYGVRWSQDPPISGVTTTLSIEFISAAPTGKWIEAHVDVVRSGSRVVFLNCFVWHDGKRVARASASCQVAGLYKPPHG